ncbi:arylesterase [Endozoicomonas sp. SM1973]|uniref:Arylesterase n=1 Tax=Spartinivicinus marinus TaxID=2994442 RepID=A0A853HV32_9GAMM|nr:arylesterase [Spartinivicinus marinus]MCX4028285.1 arylesterase [Spartinivicinus marinus]NYZ65620.1 arylesterase [Spartinivicinus marinus]
MLSSLIVRLLKPLFLLVLVSLPQLSQANTLLIFGDSLSAGYGLKEHEGWVHLLKQRIARDYPTYQVVNASISGETTTGGLARLTSTLDKFKPTIVLLELGANDGLRGLPIPQMQRNLQNMIQQIKKSGSEVILMEMRIPPNYGKRYTELFQNSYSQLAKQEEIKLMPFFLKKIAGQQQYLQPDNLHPNAKAQPLLLDNIWEFINPLLKKSST